MNYKETISKEPESKSKKTLNSHQFDINHHVDYENKQLTKEHSKYAIIYIHTTDDLSCYIVANASDTNNPEIYVLFRGTRSLKNAISDVKGMMKGSLDSEDTNNNMKAFRGALELISEVINILIIIYIIFNHSQNFCIN